MEAVLAGGGGTRGELAAPQGLEDAAFASLAFRTGVEDFLGKQARAGWGLGTVLGVLGVLGAGLSWVGWAGLGAGLGAGCWVLGWAGLGP